MNKSKLIGEINRLRKEKNAVIMSHFYQTDDIQNIADKVGDSLTLAQWTLQTDADIIVLCGVHFMGETAKSFHPIKGIDSRCGSRLFLAESCPADKFEEFIKHIRPYCDQLCEYNCECESFDAYSGYFNQCKEDH